MIARVWRGHTRSEDAERYGAFLEARALPDYRGTPGNRGAVFLKQVGRTTAEFVLVSFWESMEAIRHFAGPDAERAVYYPEDEHFLLGKEPRVSHYEMIGA
jgi:heme-degrading monooxygenase HmoA